MILNLQESNRANRSISNYYTVQKMLHYKNIQNTSKYRQKEKVILLGLSRKTLLKSNIWLCLEGGVRIFHIELGPAWKKAQRFENIVYSEKVMNGGMLLKQGVWRRNFSENLQLQTWSTGNYGTLMYIILA